VYPALHRQSAASSLPSGAWENEGQLVQLEVTWASAVEYLFKAQFAHVPMPAPVLYVPATHATHASPYSAPECPALQEQLVRLVLASNENVFAGQSRHMLCAVAAGSVPYLPAAQFVHASLPLSELYVPGGHASQPPAVAFGNDTYPGPHRQSAIVPLPAGAYELAGHGLHCAADVAASVSWYVSAGQLTHSLLLVADLYWPTGHTEHW
jgi:hypothetical protein